MVMTAEEAKEIIEKEKTEREEKCFAEINAVLEKYSCKFAPEVILREGQVLTSVKLFAI